MKGSSGTHKLALGLAIAGLTWGIEAQDYAITKQVAGSGHEAGAGRYVLSASSGQVVAGQSAGDGYQVDAGYWRQNLDLIFADNYE